MNNKSNNECGCGCIITLIIVVLFLALLLSATPYLLMIIFPFLLYKLFKKYSKRKNNEIVNEPEYTSDEQHTVSNELDSYQLERYAMMCNAYLEHEEEMEQYENHINNDYVD